MSLAELHALDANESKARHGKSTSGGARVEAKGTTFEVKTLKTQALWNAAAESPESKAVKSQPKERFGVHLEGAYRGYHSSQQRNYLPTSYPPAPGAEYRGRARQQALWNAARDGGASQFWRPKAKAHYGVPLKGAYRGYDSSKQVSYAPHTHTLAPLRADTTPP